MTRYFIVPARDFYALYASPKRKSLKNHLSSLEREFGYELNKIQRVPERVAFNLFPRDTDLDRARRIVARAYTKRNRSILLSTEKKEE